MAEMTSIKGSFWLWEQAPKAKKLPFIEVISAIVHSLAYTMRYFDEFFDRKPSLKTRSIFEHVRCFDISVLEELKM